MCASSARARTRSSTSWTTRRRWPSTGSRSAGPGSPRTSRGIPGSATCSRAAPMRPCVSGAASATGSPPGSPAPSPAAPTPPWSSRASATSWRCRARATSSSTASTPRPATSRTSRRRAPTRGPRPKSCTRSWWRRPPPGFRSRSTIRSSSTRTSCAISRSPSASPRRDADHHRLLQHPPGRRSGPPPGPRPHRRRHRGDEPRRRGAAGGHPGGRQRQGDGRPGRVPREQARHGAGDGRDAPARRRHLRQRRAHAAARGGLRPPRPEPRPARAARLPARGRGRQRRRPARLQLPLRPRLPRAARAARAAGGLHPRGLVRGTAGGDGRLQRVAPRARHARAPPGVRVADAAHARHASRRLPALPARPHLLGRGARGRGLPRPPEPPRARRLRPPPGDGAAARPPTRRHAVRHGRRASAGRVTPGRAAAAPRGLRGDRRAAAAAPLAGRARHRRAGGDVAGADVLAAAYLDAPLDGKLARLRATATRMVEPGWFRDRLLLRLADRAGDSAAREAILAAARARTAPLLRRVRALTATEVIALGLGVAGLVFVLRGRPVRVDSALVPPPWRARDGLEVLVRGAGAGVLVLMIVYALGRWRGPSDPLLGALSMPMMYVPLLWLARRRLFAPAGVGLARGLGWLPAPGGRRALIWTTALLVGAGTATDLALGLLSEATNISAHWTEWFDEELAWGSPVVAGVSLLGTVVFAPVFEEFVFRGLLYATLRRRLAWPIAATLSAAIFAIAHGYRAAGFGSVFLSGLLWAIAYERTGSLLPNTAAHVLNNMAAALGVLLLLRG